MVPRDARRNDDVIILTSLQDTFDRNLEIHRSNPNLRLAFL